MTWNESVREPVHKIYEVWLEDVNQCSYWSTEEKALTEVSKQTGIPKDQLEFYEHCGVNWLIEEDGNYVDPGITISEIEVDTGRYE